MRHLIPVLFVLFLCWLPAGTATAQQQPRPIAAEVEQLETAHRKHMKSLARIMARWKNLREQQYPQHPSRVRKAGVAERLKRLLMLKQLNRQRHAYWKQERDIVGALVLQLNICSNSGDALSKAYRKLLPSLEGRLKIAAAKRKTQENQLSALERRLAATIKLLESKRNALEQAQKRRAKPLQLLHKVVAKARAGEKRLSRKKESEAYKKAAEHLKAVEKQLDSATRAQRRDDVLFRSVKRNLDELKKLRDRKPISLALMTPKSSEQKLARDLLNVRQSSETARAEQKSAETLNSKTRKRETTLRNQSERFKRRVPDLKVWVKHAGSVMRSYDRELALIERDSEAVDDLVKRFETLAEDRQLLSKSGKDTARSYGRSESPYREYQLKLTRLRLRARAHSLDKREAEMTRELVNAELSFLLQRRPLLELRRNQHLRRKTGLLGADKLETAGWIRLRRFYATRASTGEKQVRAALTSLDLRVQRLRLMADYQDSVIRFKTDRLQEYQKQIETASSAVWKALLSTVWQWLRQSALWVVVLLLMTWLALWLVRVGADRVLIRLRRREGRIHREETLMTIGTGLARIVVLIIFGIWILRSMNVDVSPILGGAAIFGLALSFGSQSLVKDVVSGFFILFEAHYSVGDIIQIGDIWGWVERITLRRTVLRTLDGTLHQFPNGNIANVANRTHGWKRAMIIVGVHYNSDMDHVENVCNQVCQEMYDDPKWRKLLFDCPQYIGIERFADSAIEVLILGRTKIFEDRPIKWEMHKRLKRAFDQQGVVIAFPQRDVHLYYEKPAENGSDSLPAPG